MKPTLHLVNGASTAGSLRATGQADHTAYWHESLYIGPLKILNDSDFRKLREQWWSAFFAPDWILHTKYASRKFPTLTALLPELSHYESIILWLEFDLYDQSMLWYILRIFAENRDALPRLSIISPDTVPGVDNFKGLGQLHSDQLKNLLGTEVPITDAQLDEATLNWEAFASNDPSQMKERLNHPTAFPYAHRAFKARLKQLTVNSLGMNDIQLALLADIKKGGRKPILYYIGKLMATYDSDYGLSDRAALEELLKLSTDPRKLIEFVQQGKVVVWDREQTRQTKVQITQVGSDLLDSL